MFIFKRIRYNSPVILTFTLLALAVLLLGMATGGVSTQLLFMVYRSPLTDPLTYVRLFGHVLGHANFAHYFGNFLLILLVGPMLEEKYGSKVILIVMAATALITGLLNVILFPTGLMGASGIVFAFILLSSFANYQKGTIPLTLILVVIVFIGQEIASISTPDNISQLTHIVGGVCGAVLGYFTNNKQQTGKKTVQANIPPQDGK